MKKFTKAFIISICVVIVFVVSVAIISFNTGNTSVTSGFARVFMPVQKGASFIVNGTKNTFGDIINSKKNARENKKLKKEINELRDELRMVEGYKLENESLRKSLELRDMYAHESGVAANVIGRDTGDLYNTLTIDKGSKDGIRINSVAVVPEGLVGVVCEVGKNYAKIKTIVDASSSVSALCLRSGDMGVIEGNSKLSKSGKCVMNYIDKDAKTVVGDSIETSGTGGIFPRGILIGKITEIKEDERKLTLTATVKTSVNINNLTSVIIYR
ncbi:MAG: rod shape-determining protein MreC [Clostridia bacterium]|nr:rod shape-determining protein MreC [Clostridia bacterium]